jgi:hypothetical protein
VRDWVSAEITLKKGLCGAKPEAVAWWLFSLLGLRGNDTVTDIFPGTGVVGRVWQQYRREGSLFSQALEEPPSMNAVDPVGRKVTD